MSDHFKKNAYSWGSDGKAWYKNIPMAVAEFEHKWSFRAEQPFALNYNYVAPVVLQDGSAAVLKLGFPKDKEFYSEINALKIFNGEGICQLLEVDEQKAAVLIERILPDKPISELDDDDEATRITASVMRKLHKPLPANHPFMTVDDLMTVIPEYREKFPDNRGPIPTALIDRAEELVKTLASASVAPVLVHGDLHQDNILSSDKHGWVAIDPKGIAAEPGYDAAAMLRNPYEKLKDIADLQPLLKNRIKILSQELEIDPRRITGWGIVHTVLSAVWSVDGVKGPEHALRVAQALNHISLE